MVVQNVIWGVLILDSNVNLSVSRPQSDYLDFFNELLNAMSCLYLCK